MTTLQRYLKHSLGVTLLLSSATAFAASLTPHDVPGLLNNLLGCFEVSYRYIEDGPHDFEIRNTFEWVEVATDGPAGALTFQHWGIHEGEKFRHWREEWRPTSGGKWNQTVYGPTGRLRYNCEGAWNFSQISCEVPNAPKPQRDTNRDDYDVLDRSNRIQISTKAWVQVETNVKKKSDGTLVASEVGWNEYRKVDATKCQVPAAHVR